MDPEVIAASIAAAVALVLAVVNWVTAMRQDRRVTELERLKSELVLEQVRDKARLDYEYEARRRLHSTAGPAMFQLMDLAEFAIEMIKQLTDPAVWIELAKTEANPPATVRPSLPRPKYETVAALYGLYAPLVVIRGLGRNLSQLDLSLEPVIELQYHLCSKVYGSFKDDLELAALEPAVSYRPFAPGWRDLRLREPRTYWWQGLSMGRLEGMLDLMSVEVGSGSPRVVSFGEFERLYDDIFNDRGEERRKTVAAAANALHCFRPVDRPVFWRMLIAQARLYQGLLRTRASTFRVPESRSEWHDLLFLEAPETFQWRSPDHAGAPLAETLKVTTAYLDAKAVMTWQRQHPGAASD
jgi:hypothetical protein